jgi:hypothetical protein
LSVSASKASGVSAIFFARCARVPAPLIPLVAYETVTAKKRVGEKGEAVDQKTT